MTNVPPAISSMPFNLETYKGVILGFVRLLRRPFVAHSRTASLCRSGRERLSKRGCVVGRRAASDRRQPGSPPMGAGSVKAAGASMTAPNAAQIVSTPGSLMGLRVARALFDDYAESDDRPSNSALQRLPPGRLAKSLAVSGCKMTGLGKPVAVCDLGDGLRLRLGLPQSPAYLSEPVEQHVTASAHPEDA